MLDETQSQFVAITDRVAQGLFDRNGETYLTRLNGEQTKTEFWNIDESWLSCLHGVVAATRPLQVARFRN